MLAPHLTKKCPKGGVLVHFKWKLIMIKFVFLPFIFTLTLFIDASSVEIEKINPQALTISAAGIKLIERFEGFNERAYICPGNKLTIGFGHVIKEFEVEIYSGTMTRDEGNKLLACDVTEFYVPDVRRLVKVPLSQGQFDALTSFDYNLGAVKFGDSTLLKHLNGGDYHHASLQFLLWRNAGGKYLPGLFKRRLAEMFIFRDSSEIPQDLATIPTSVQGENLLKVYQDLRDDLKKEAQTIYLDYKANNR